MNKPIDTELFSSHLRDKAIDIDRKALLITNFFGSKQEQDLTEPANCRGFGRIRHFKLDAGKDWVQNPLPILPAAKALGRTSDSQIRAQVFQNSVCNWRCWYCFVDFKLLSGDAKHASFITCDEMIDLYLAEPNPAPMIDLTGGQPDLTPEWVPWMMEALKKRGLNDKVYLWSDDNLSNDYFWRYLNNDQIDLISSYKKYARVCCFKGIDEPSFSLNTKADPKLYNYQFELCKRILQLNVDTYFYITLTASTTTQFDFSIPRFLDLAQEVDVLLPLKIIPLRVFEFTPVSPRMNKEFADMLEGQYLALDVWNKELERRYSSDDRALAITDVKLRKY